MTTSWVQLADMRDYLRFQGTDTSDDDQLADKIDSACAVIETIKGHIAPTPITGETETVNRLGLVLLNEGPVISVEAVSLLTSTGPVVIPKADPSLGATGAGWTLSSKGGVLTVPRWGSTVAPLGSTVQISYTVGRDPIPANYVDAAKELAAHLYRTSQLNEGGGRMDVGEPDTEWMRGSAGSSNYALPFKVRELLGLFGSVVKSQVFVR